METSSVGPSVSIPSSVFSSCVDVSGEFGGVGVRDGSAETFFDVVGEVAVDRVDGDVEVVRAAVVGAELWLVDSEVWGEEDDEGGVGVIDILEFVALEDPAV